MIKIQSVAKWLGNRIWKPDKKYFLTLDWGKQCTDGQGDTDSWDVQRLIPSQSLHRKWLIFFKSIIFNLCFKVSIVNSHYNFGFNCCIHHCFWFRLLLVLPILLQAEVSVAIIVLSEKNTEVISHQYFLPCTDTDQILKTI